MQYIVGFLSLLALASCQAKTELNNHDIIQVKLISGLPCPSQRGAALARWVPNGKVLQQLTNKYPQHAIDNGTNLTSFDFKKQKLLLVTMGQRSNTGYRLELVDGKLRRKGEDWVLHLRWIRPEANRFYATVITYPCLWLGMPKLPDRGVRIVDEKGKQHFYLPKS